MSTEEAGEEFQPEATEGEAEEQRPPPPLHVQLYEQVKAADRSQIENRDNLGDLAFDQAPHQVNRITAVLQEFAEEPWERIDPSFRNDFANHAGVLQQTLNDMGALRSSQPDSQQRKDQLQAALDGEHGWFLLELPPRSTTAYVRKLLRQGDLGASVRQAEEEVGALENLVNEVRSRGEELVKRQTELESTIEPALRAAREAAGTTAAADLAIEYENRANAYEGSARRWLTCLIVAVAVAVGGGIGVLIWTRPEADATNAEIAQALVTDVLVIGVLVFLVRVASMQFRVSKHLETVARSKAAALRTFNRIISTAQEPDVRTALAQVLGNSVFATGDTGLIDSSADQVTVVERVIGAVPRGASPA